MPHDNKKSTHHFYYSLAYLIDTVYLFRAYPKTSIMKYDKISFEM